MISELEGIKILASEGVTRQSWHGPLNTVQKGSPAVQQALNALTKPVFVVGERGTAGVTNEGELKPSNGQAGLEMWAFAPAVRLEQLGDPGFNHTYGARYAYMAGAMANGIASVELVVALGKAGMLGSFGAAGMVPPRLESAIQGVQEALPNGPCAFNLIHSPSEEAMERSAVDLYMKYKIRVVEASAFLDLTPSVVYYRAAGLSLSAEGKIQIQNRVIIKLSRKEVATKFMSPAPERILSQLVAEGKVSEVQARLAQQVPVADDVTIEADSGGHTDNRPLVVLLPTMLSLRDELQQKYKFDTPVRVGAGGGISTPAAVLGAFMMGAAYVVTGSVNQACVEAGASAHTKKLLAQASMTDVTMAPSADMFEMGVKVQVLKNGTFFPMRAQKLYELYSRFDSVEALPADERDKLEKQVFKRDMESIWQDTVKFFMERDPDQITRANSNPKRKMALIFRWYLGLSSRWSNAGEMGREMDYQIWCGPSIGSFNDWTKGTYLALPENRKAADVGLQLMTGAAYLWRVQQLKLQGVQFAAGVEQYRPERPLV
ncbi:MAG TPA: PfaD family polyunsaturated fatty acid/polyketide biosynthesis protein [Anaerolineaceae bacterium]|nr:PfaD family polyunsaturated fatty acid/polyketide biosynthesis protein [Anaerolineaceae bacterium]